MAGARRTISLGMSTASSAVLPAYTGAPHRDRGTVAASLDEVDRCVLLRRDVAIASWSFRRASAGANRL